MNKKIRLQSKRRLNLPTCAMPNGIATLIPRSTVATTTTKTKILRLIYNFVDCDYGLSAGWSICAPWRSGKVLDSALGVLNDNALY